MSVFKDAVQDCLLDQPPNPNPNPNPKPKPYNKSLGDDPQLDKFSGLRIRFIPCICYCNLNKCILHCFALYMFIILF